MTTAATTLLGLALPVTGELSGTWGDTVNNSITSLLDTAVAGTTTLSTDADVTLTTTTLASNQARQAILLCSGARTALRTITAPAQSKIYTIINATTGGFSVKLVGVGPTTGLTIPNGASAVVAWNGSDFIEVGSATVGNLTVNGNLSVTGTTSLTGVATLTANPVLSAGTANGVAYLNGSKVVTTGSALVFDGTNLKVGAPSFAPNTNLAGNLLQLKSASGFAYLTMGNGDGANNTGYIGSASGLLTFGSVTDAGVTSEQMRLTSTGLGIGTSSPSTRLTIGGYSSANQTPDIQITRSSSGTAIQTGPNITFGDGTTNNSTTLQVTQGRFGVWNYGAGVWNERMSIDSSGNLGLGVTPSAWGSSSALQMAGGQSYSRYGITNNAYYDGGNYRYISTAAATLYGNNAGSHLWFNAASGTAGNAITFTQAMTLDASGNLGVGETSPALRLHVKSASAAIGYFETSDTGIGPYVIWRNGTTSIGDVGSGKGINGSGNATDFMIASRSTYPLLLGTGSIERARIDSSGNLGVGTTSTSSRFEAVAGTGAQDIARFRTGDATAANNAGGGFYANSSATAGSRYAYMWLDADGANFSGLDYFSIYKAGNSGGVEITNVSNSYMTFGTNNTERARIDASGNLLVGSTSTSGLITGQLQLGTTSSSTAGIQVLNSTTGVGGIYFGDSSSGNARFRGMVEYNHNADALVLSTAETERARIDNSGNLLIGRTTVPVTNTAGVGIQYNGLIIAESSQTQGGLWVNRITSDGNAVYFTRQNVLIGTISVTGSATAYNTSSDYRLKENIQPMTGALAKVAALKPVTYKWKADGSDGEGFIAHELAEVVPQCVTGEKDAVDEDGKPVYQGIDTSFLVATLTAALQEAVAEINQLKADVAALKGN